MKAFKSVGLLTICLLLTLILSLGVCMAAEPQYGGTFRWPIVQEPKFLDPPMYAMSSVQQITCNLYSGLLRFNEDMSDVLPDLAESWRQVDPLTYEFKIRKGAHFHNIPPVNGRECTAADVKYSIERTGGMYGKKAEFKQRHYFEGKLTSIETPDKYTVIFKTKDPYPAFIQYLASPMTKIVPKEAVDKFGDLKRKAIGTGPFILKEFVRGSHLTMVKNPNYFKKGLPYLDAIHMKVLPDPTTVMAQFIAGDQDVISLYYWQIPTIKKEVPNVIITKKAGVNSWMLRTPPQVDCDKPLAPPFNDIRVKQAISHAIDKKKLLKLALDNHGDILISHIANFPPYHLGLEDQIEYNPEKSKKLLAQAGYPKGFSVEMLTWNAPYMLKPAQVLIEMLKEVGIKVNLKVLEMAQYFTRAYHFKYDMALHVGSSGIDPEEALVPYYGRDATYYKMCDKEIW
ncbi:MAG: ABC transporter substrate-binding protein, partial [Deltaproteobacteria bacterium]|nr:ABC transporter substrate-binding protein [Deltaproteobacteria bacterium]